jgi:hypothetical protein
VTRHPALFSALTAGAAALAVTGAVLIGLAVDQHVHHGAAISHPTPVPNQLQRQAATQSGSRADPARPNASSANPLGVVSSITSVGATLVIPALDVQAPVVAVGGTDGSMLIPADVHQVGWYDGIDNQSGVHRSAAPTAPWPGQPGVALIAGHVNWAGQGPGALSNLGRLRVGDLIQVVGSNRTTTAWQVSQAPITLPKSALPHSLFVNTGPSRVALVTCGGPYDRTTGHYRDNVIVWADPAK